MWVAALLAVGVIGAAAMPAGAQTQSPAVAGQAAASVPPWTKELFSSLGKGAASHLGGVAAGWALDAMGLSAKSSDELEALKSINGNLLTIISELNGLKLELQQLNATLQQLNCDWLSSNLNDWLTRIDSLATTYQAFNALAAGTYGTPTVPPLDSMTTWAAQVTNDVNGVGPALHAISNALLPAGSAQGIIGACLQKGVIHPPEPGTFGDTTYYEHVANLIDYYYAYQVRGLLLLQEAYHFQAEQASGKSPDPESPSAICDDDMASQATNLACTTAIIYTNHVYERLAHQFARGGLPYTDDETILQNTGGPNPPLYVRSLEKFTKAAGQLCRTPLTSAAPCGVTVASADDTANVAAPMRVEYDGYSTWWPAGTYHLEEMIRNRGSMTPGQYLNAHGFEYARDKVLLTPQTTTIRNSVWVPPHFEIPGYWKDISAVARCFLDTDTSFGVACSNGVFESHVLGSGPRYECYGPRLATFVNRDSLPGNRNGFYTAWWRANRNTGPSCHYHFDPQPGWELTGKNSSNPRQYRWPKLQVGSDLTCTDGRSPTNPGGVPTRCGHNFDTVLDTLVPRPEECGGTTFAHCEKIEVETSRAVLRSGRVPITLACVPALSDGPCSGRLSLSVRVWRVVRRRIDGHGVTVPVAGMVTIGHRRYHVDVEKASTLTVQVTRNGERRLEASAHHRLSVRVSATVSGGGGGHRQVIVRSS